MSTQSNNNKRIAKNTLLLYFRMFGIMAVSLYTSRVVLKTLGVEDFGIYNVVGGVVAMFAFINSAMASTTQRYLTFELGKNNIYALNRVFCVSMLIHIMIASIIFVLGETIGLWFFYNKMFFPAERIDAALLVYQLSILSTIVMIVSAPYNACIIAHEKMSAFAYISVLEVLIKLGIVYVLWLTPWDKLKLYAILMFLAQVLIRIIYGRYCSRNFSETKFKMVRNKSLFKEMLSFAGWNLWGNCASVFYTQGLNILLNMFFGPVVNAARGIAVQVQAAIMQFSNSFQTALNPQITKSYATNDLNYMHRLIFNASKYTFFLMLFLSVPVLLNMPFLLKIWLSEYPEYTVSFSRLMICCTIVDAVANPLMISASATGNVRKYQSLIGGILLCILPVSYLVLRLGANPMSVFIVHLAICVIAFIVRLFVVRPMISLSIVAYCKEVVLKVFLVCLISLVVPCLEYIYIDGEAYRFVITSVTSFIATLLAVYFAGLNNSEQLFVKRHIVRILMLRK